VEADLVDAGTGEAVLVFRKRLGWSGLLAERDRERQGCLRSTLPMVEKTWVVGASPGSDARSSSENERGTVSSQTRSSMGVVKTRIDSRLRASQGRVAPAW
jgi:hypothetical protein